MGLVDKNAFSGHSAGKGVFLFYLMLRCDNKRYVLTSWAKEGQYVQESEGFNVDMHARPTRNIG